MTTEEICERLEQAAHGTTRRAAMATMLGGALLLGGSETSDANRRAKRRRKRRRKGWPESRLIEVWLRNDFSMEPVAVSAGYWYAGNDCCRSITATTILPGGNLTIQAGRVGNHQYANNAWTWIGEKYWFRYYNPGIGKPGIGIAINGMLDHSSTPPCCVTMPWGQTVEYQRSFDPGQSRSYNIENRALFKVDRLPDSSTHIRFQVMLPNVIPPAADAAE